MDRTDIEHLVNAERAVIAKLGEINAAIEAHHKKCNIAKTTGASVSAAGVVSTIAGVCLAPATGGMSLALTAGGIGASVAGGATSIGTDIVSHFRYKKYAAELETVLKERLEAYHLIGTKIEKSLAQVSCEGAAEGQLLAIAPLPTPSEAPPLSKKIKAHGKKSGQVFRTKEEREAETAAAAAEALTSGKVPAAAPATATGLMFNAKCHAKPTKGAICITGLQAVSTSVDSATKIYDTSKILSFLYLNREIYSISNLSASLLAQNQLSGLLLGTVRQALNKGLVKLGARIGLNGLKVGARTMLIGLGVVGIAWDAFSLVRTWSNKPEMWKEVVQLIGAIQAKIDQLELFMQEE